MKRGIDHVYIGYDTVGEKKPSNYTHPAKASRYGTKHQVHSNCGIYKLVHIHHFFIEEFLYENRASPRR